MISNVERSRHRLKEAGIKPTFQRTVILDAVWDNPAHPTIRDLHRGLLRIVPTLSKTTLYSTLGLFARHGLVTALSINPAEIRYDGVGGPHHHFFCVSCGRILDLDLVCVNSRRGEIHGHRITEIHGYFKGICRDCRSAPPAGAAAASSRRPASRRKTHAQRQ